MAQAGGNTLTTPISFTPAGSWAAEKVEKGILFGSGIRLWDSDKRRQW